jgi:hypothetical protein
MSPEKVIACFFFETEEAILLISFKAKSSNPDWVIATPSIFILLLF